MPELQAEDEQLRLRRRADMQQFDALTTRNDPAHGGTSRQSVTLISDGVLCVGQAPAQPLFSQTRDQSTPHHDHPKRDDPLSPCNLKFDRQKA
jgi:hypothetical protein